MKDTIAMVITLLTCFGGGFVFVAAPFFQRRKRKRCTRRIMAEYKTCKTVYAARSMYNTYIPCFSYTYNGQEYTSMPVGVNLSKRKIMEYHSDRQYEVCIDPDNPQLMCLQKGNTGKGIVQFVIGLGLLGSGFSLVLSFLSDII